MCRAILAPKNKAVDRINDEILQSLTQKSYICSSVDAILDPEIVNSISEFTRTNETPHQSGISLHSLELWVSILLLWNLDPPNLCNGAKLVFN